MNNLNLDLIDRLIQLVIVFGILYKGINSTGSEAISFFTLLVPSPMAASQLFKASTRSPQADDKQVEK